MNHKYTPQEIQTVLDFLNNGKSVAEIARGTGIPRSTIYAWMKKRREQSDG